jgi:DNA-binding XRE family transcriptional regulator
MATEYGSRLKQSRKHAGFTQVELSKKTGIPQSTISTAEREGNGSGETPVYAQACGVNALWLANGTGEMLDGKNTSNNPVVPVNQAPVAMNNAALNTALETLCAALNQVDPAMRDALLGTLTSLAKSPGNAQLKDALLTILTPAAFASPERKQA